MKDSTTPNRMDVFGDSLVNNVPSVEKKRRKRAASKKRRVILKAETTAAG